MAFLIGPGRDIDAAAKRARDLQPVDHAQRAIQPAGMRLGLDMAAEQQLRPVAARAADDVADAVDLRRRARPRVSRAASQWRDCTSSGE